MGEATLVIFGALAVTGLLFIALAIYSRARLPLAVGLGILLGLAGAWLFGLMGIALGVIGFAVLKRGRTNPPAST